MPIRPKYEWISHAGDMQARKFICGHFGCGREVGSIFVTDISIAAPKQ